MLPPREPRMACGMVFVSGSHKMSLELSVARGTVSNAGAAESADEAGPFAAALAEAGAPNAVWVKNSDAASGRRMRAMASMSRMWLPAVWWL